MSADIIESAMSDTQSESVVEHDIHNRIQREAHAREQYRENTAECLNELFKTFNSEKLRTELIKVVTSDNLAKSMLSYETMFINYRKYS